MNKLLDYSERLTRAELLKLPEGTFEAEDKLDDDGITPEPVHLRARVTISDGHISFDFSGTDPQRPAPMNCNLTQTFTACVYVVKCLIDPDIPLNDGFYRFIHVTAPEASAVNASHPTATVGGWEVSMRLCELLFSCLSQALPADVPAGTKGTVCQVGFGGKDPRTGDYYCFYETIAGGYGGRNSSDGPDAVQTHFQNTQNAPVEETELNYPVRILRYALVPDSEGPGEMRGGLGICREYVFLHDDVVFTTLADRVKFPARGLFGGGPGRCARYLLIAGRDTTELPSKGTVQVKAGDVVRIETPGGGGYGRTAQRSTVLVLRDVEEEKISPKRAMQCYGVLTRGVN